MKENSTCNQILGDKSLRIREKDGKHFFNILHCRFSRKWQTRRLQNLYVRGSGTTAHSQITHTTVTSIKNPTIRGLHTYLLLQKMATLFQQLQRSICSRSFGVNKGYSLGNFRLLPSYPHITHKTETWILKEHLKCKIWSAKCDAWNVTVDRKYKIPCVELCASRHTVFFFFAVLFDCLFVLFLSFSVSVSRLWISKHSKLNFIIVLLAMDRNIDRLVLESFTTTKWTTFRLQGLKTRSVFYHQNQIWSYQGKDLNPPPHPLYLWIKAEWHVWFLVRLVERK